MRAYLPTRVEVRKWLNKATYEGLAPEPLLTVSLWADKNRVLSSKSSAEHGRWRTDRTPYLREIMDHASPTSPVQKIVLKAASQMGKSEACNNAVGFYVHRSPAPILFVQPTVDLARRYSWQRIGPMFADSDVLTGLLSGNFERNKTNSVLFKEFPGGVLAFTGANSSVGLCSMAARILLLDEVDRFPEDVDGEGDPCDLAIKRAMTFGNRKIFLCSTPTIQGVSRIEREYKATDQRELFVACPKCSNKQYLRWAQFQWDDHNPETVRYVCEFCSFWIRSAHKQKLLDTCEWRPTRELNDPTVAGYHLPAFYAPPGWYDWPQLVKDWLAAQKNKRKLQVFINTALAETWREKGKAPNWEKIYARRGKYRQGTLPRGVCFLTMGVDVQKDRLEAEVWGWGKGKSSWSIDRQVLMGDTSQMRVWDQLRRLIFDVQYPYADDPAVTLRVVRAAVDTGYNTQFVYSWGRRVSMETVMLVKGQYGGAGQPLGSPFYPDVDFGGKTIRRGVCVWPVFVNQLKSEFYTWLDMPTAEDADTGEPVYPEGYCHFPEYEEEYFRQLCAEEERVKGQRVIWEKVRERNEALDRRIYARVAAYQFGMDRLTPEQWDELTQRVRVGTIARPSAKRGSLPRVMRSSYMDS